EGELLLVADHRVRQVDPVHSRRIWAKSMKRNARLRDVGETDSTRFSEKPSHRVGVVIMFSRAPVSITQHRIVDCDCVAAVTPSLLRGTDLETRLRVPSSAVCGACHAALSVWGNSSLGG